MAPDQIYSRATEAGADSYLTDRLGSVIALADQEGEVNTSYTYDPFGVASSSGAPSDNPYQFTGRENDGTGLQYNRARYYSPQNGRFISQDPLGFDGGSVNLYEYALNDPLGFRDPSGKCVIVCVEIPNPFAELEKSLIGAAEDASNQVGEWVSHYWDTALIGGTTLLVGVGTVSGITLCMAATDGIESLDCIKGFSPGIVATIGGVYATYESTRN